MNADVCAFCFWYSEATSTADDRDINSQATTKVGAFAASRTSTIPSMKMKRQFQYKRGDIRSLRCEMYWAENTAQAADTTPSSVRKNADNVSHLRSIGNQPNASH